MALRKCACIDTLYTELDWLDRFQAAKDDGFEAVGSGLAHPRPGRNPRGG